MSMLYSLLILMLLCALALLAVPFVANKSFISRSFLIITLLTIAFSGLLYRTTFNPEALNQWFTTGAKHYQLAEKLDQLGGIDGVIVRIKKKLEDNPEDATGWIILGKLYLAQHNYNDAKIALQKARELHPQNDEINKLYNAAINQTTDTH